MQLLKLLPILRKIFLNSYEYSIFASKPLKFFSSYDPYEFVSVNHLGHAVCKLKHLAKM